MTEKNLDQNNQKISNILELLERMREFASNLRDKLNKELES
jgi:hypothetical protein